MCACVLCVMPDVWCVCCVPCSCFGMCLHVLYTVWLFHHVHVCVSSLPCPEVGRCSSLGFHQRQASGSEKPPGTSQDSCSEAFGFGLCQSVHLPLPVLPTSPPAPFSLWLASP